MLRALWVRIRTVITDAGFPVSVLFTFVLFMTAAVWTDRMTYDEYSAFTALLHYPRDVMLEDIGFSSVEVLRKCGTGWLKMFLPITAAFAWTKVFCARRESGVMRFEMVRKSRFSHCFSDYFAGCISGGLVTLSAFLLYAAVVFLLYPNISDYPEAMVEAYRSGSGIYHGTVYTVRFSSVLLEYSGRLVLYGIFVTVPVMAVAGVSRSAYTMLCIPFFLIYALSQLIIKLQSDGLSENARHIISSVTPGALLYTNQPIWQPLLPRIIFCAACGIFFAGTQLAKTDKGGSI